ncbi:hypothetical protein [Rickettsia rhipicephali]|uniref:hypothetical protein n=1 Tax=Rickettsia rhipicephali TaxID=33992 RepID=UPI000A59CC78|nr:hypothetical protein [Rickettsia rhipicephali]
MSITSFIYSNNLVIPHGVSVSMAEIARDSIGEGIIIAQQIPPSFVHELIKEVNITFINAFNSRYYSRNNHANIGGCDYVCSSSF